MSQRRIKGRRGAVPEYGLVYRDHDGRMRRQTCTSCACDVAAFTRLCVKLGRDLPKIDLGEMIERFKIENSPESVAHFLQHHCTNHNLHLVLSDEETL
ncbi:MAG: hypothetical protein LAQ30_31780, partial [Acidobacteriia bacterium]|nr:hypothetical protein [Terriglobia bacterium]